MLIIIVIANVSLLCVISFSDIRIVSSLSYQNVCNCIAGSVSYRIVSSVSNRIVSIFSCFSVVSIVSIINIISSVILLLLKTIKRS